MIEEGKPAPEFELRSDSGEQVSLASLRRKPVVLYFYPKDDAPVVIFRSNRASGSAGPGLGRRWRRVVMPDPVLLLRH